MSDLNVTFQDLSNEMLLVYVPASISNVGHLYTVLRNVTQFSGSRIVICVS